MKSLIITTTHSGKINPNLLPLVDAATKISDYCDVLIFGSDLATASIEAATISKINTVFTIEAAELKNPLAENIATQLAEIAKGYSHVLCAADSTGKNLMPRIAGILEIGQISEIVKVVSPNIFKKFIYAGNVLVEVESLEDIKLLTVRTSNFNSKHEPANQNAKIVPIAYKNPIHPHIKWQSENIVDKSVDLSSAKIVVSGGRSLGSKEEFDKHVRGLALKLNAAVGATRAAVEAGYAPNDCQVGQTGKVVAPQVYLAIGVSGAVQHIAGMKDSKIVIAINTDQTAPIFEHADYGIVADLFDIVPELTEKL
ncbi:MAG: electron transfer flavoprotein subunit alpha [Burkholderiales bacterium]|jgi:electron transfer flavoprotein alpha subunit|nr:electron transfer flavoprotein subunit alpha [Burkholderiales bacterium]